MATMAQCQMLNEPTENSPQSGHLGAVEIYCRI